jgi:hypothetical protein
MSINSFLNQSVSLKFIIVIGGFWLFVAAIAVYYFFGGIKEGFQAGLVGLGSALNYKMGDGVKRSWENNSMVENAEASIKTTVSNQLNGEGNDTYNVFAGLEGNEGGPVPLPEGELLIFKTNKFSPECCPSSYSTGDGCVCASPEQMKYLNERGGNRTLASEY